MITISNLQISYDKHPALNDLNLTMDCGFIHGILSLNGSGKTTLLNTLFRLKKKNSGEVL
ncbi:MAG: ATP-binding cassette domain-containing protein [Prevotellaceae bacterium]|jgi:ABC-type cobalamin/Fe3+-siderophores transport system ATPase subunit|nr:ATP-binding cassette domain-containing protein [Prevotellaceae bacterium]